MNDFLELIDGSRQLVVDTSDKSKDDLETTNDDKIRHRGVDRGDFEVIKGHALREGSHFSLSRDLLDETTSKLALFT